MAVGVFTNPFENGTKVKITFEVKQPLLKVGQSRNVFFKQMILPKNKRTNLFVFLPNNTMIELFRSFFGRIRG